MFVIPLLLGVTVVLIYSAFFPENALSVSAIIDGITTFWTQIGVIISTFISLYIIVFVLYGILGGLLFYFFLTLLSEVVSRLGIYHRVGKKDNGPGETFRRKLWLVFLCNLFVAIPLSLAILSILNPSFEPSPNNVLSDLNYAIIVTFTVIPGSLLSLRLLVNPAKRFSTRYISQKILSHSDPNERLLKIREMRERYLSFYFSLIGASLLFLYFNSLYTYLKSGIKPEATISTLISFPISVINPIVLALLLFPEIVAIAITTCIGEYVLAKAEPLDQVELDTKRE